MQLVAQQVADGPISYRLPIEYPYVFKTKITDQKDIFISCFLGPPRTSVPTHEIEIVVLFFYGTKGSIQFVGAIQESPVCTAQINFYSKAGAS